MNPAQVDAVAGARGELVRGGVGLESAIDSGRRRKGADHRLDGDGPGLLAGEHMVGGGGLEHEATAGPPEGDGIPDPDRRGPARARSVAVQEDAEVEDALCGIVPPHRVGAQRVAHEDRRGEAGAQLRGREGGEGAERVAHDERPEEPDAQLLAREVGKVAKRVARDAHASKAPADRLRLDHVPEVRELLAEPREHQPTILFSGYSMMPTAPAFRRRGIRSRTVASAVTLSSSTQSVPWSCDTVGAVQAVRMAVTYCARVRVMW